MARTRQRYATLTDAQNDLDGQTNWDWGGLASWDGWTRYAYEHAVETNRAAPGFPANWTWDHDATLIAYLESMGEDPLDYL